MGGYISSSLHAKTFHSIAKSKWTLSLSLSFYILFLSLLALFEKENSTAIVYRAFRTSAVNQPRLRISCCVYSCVHTIAVVSFFELIDSNSNSVAD